jgi:hypothetical protein
MTGRWLATNIPISLVNTWPESHNAPVRRRADNRIEQKPGTNQITDRLGPISIMMLPHVGLKIIQ